MVNLLTLVNKSNNSVFFILFIPFADNLLQAFLQTEEILWPKLISQNIYKLLFQNIFKKEYIYNMKNC